MAISKTVIPSKATLDEFQISAVNTYDPTRIMILGREDIGDVYEADWVYLALGLVGEAGEVTEKLKKIVRNKHGRWSYPDNEELAKELGDVLWYLAVLADAFGIPLSQIAEMNQKKLEDRVKRKVVKSEGDNR
jgi:NTP pyrophosphatase (non-canonical NTP hydrolase)